MTGYVADLSWKSWARTIEKLSTEVDAGSFKNELLNRLWSILAVNVLREMWDCEKYVQLSSF
jgi:hypothetical protein